jgi:hypothetical protein
MPSRRPAPSRLRLTVISSVWFLFVPWDIGVVQGEVPPAPRATVAVTLVGERADSWRMERAVETLLGLDGVAVEWRRSPVDPPPGDLVDDRAPGVARRHVLVDMRDSFTVNLRWLTTGETAPAARTIAVETFDEASCEAIAQILRSVLLAPRQSARSAVPIPAAAAGSFVSSSTSTSTSASAAAAASLPPPGRERRLEVRLGYVATGQGGDLLFLAGPTLAGSWVAMGKRRGGAPTVGVSVTRASGVFADAAAPADASVVIWSWLAGIGWEYMWADAWWLAVEANLGPDRIEVTPRANGGTAGLQLASPQTAVRIAIRPVIRAEVRLAGPVVLFLQTQANLTPGARVEFKDTGTSRSPAIEGRMMLGGAIGAALRW